MPGSIFEQALLVAAISTGLMAGIYFSFSVFVMTSLKELPDSTAVASMNSINRVILKSSFIPLFFGSCLLALFLMLFVDAGSSSLLTGSAGVIYLLGMLTCTIVFNIPLNNRLQTVTRENESQVWQHYVIHWTRWNHIRTVSSLLAFIFYLIALI